MNKKGENEMKVKKLLALVLALTLTIVLFAGCQNNDNTSNNNNNNQPSTQPPSTQAPPIQQPSQAPATQAPAEKVAESITYGFRNNSWDLSPWKNNGSSGNTVFLQLYSGLMANPGFGTALEDMHYDMAESVSFSADKLTATIKLRDYIHDSQGNPIKAQDVVFSYKTAPKISGVYAKLDSLLDSVSVLNELTVEMKIKKLAPGTWESILSYCPVVSKKWYEGASDSDKAINPATTGAYRVAENIVGDSITLVALDDFWQKDELRSVYQIVNVKTIRCVAIVEDAMRLIALESGELDAAYLENSSYARFVNNPDFNIFPTIMFNPTTFVLNCAEGKPFYNNVALRQAVLHAIDFEQVMLACSGEFAFQSHDVALSICGDYDPAWDSQPYFEYDLDLARQYLNEAGYNENSGLTLHFMCRNVGPQQSAVVVAQSNLADIGIKVIVDPYDQALFDTYTPDPTQWDIIWQSASMTTGFVTESWEWYFGSRGDMGTVGFVKDEKLQQLLDTAKDKNDAASLNAFRDYTLEQGYAVNAFMELSHQIARKEITALPYSFIANLALNAAIFID